MDGKQIRQEREARGWSQAQLGAQLGTDGTQVSRWEMGKVVPGEVTVKKLEAVFSGAAALPTVEDRLAQLEAGQVRLEAKLDRVLEALGRLLEQPAASTKVNTLGAAGKRSDGGLAEFAGRVLEAANRVPKAGRFGTDRVFISRVWSEYKRVHGPRTGIVAFKEKLLAANNRRLLSLVCADMPGQLDPISVQESETPVPGASADTVFHFVCV